MRILITGSRGMIGSALREHWLAERHEVLRLVRPNTGMHQADCIPWDPRAGTIDISRLEAIDAVVHLAGENIAKTRWTPKHMQMIQHSRLDTTQTLCRALAKLRQPPAVLLCASATGYYGSCGDAPLTETSPMGQGFLPQVCQAWEAATQPAIQAGIRTLHLRLAMVLSLRGGALTQMLPLFRWGLGGRLGSGKQWWPWIALADVVGAIDHLLEHPELSGPINLVAPEPATNAQFTQALSKAVGRPAFLPVPAWALKWAVGPMAQALLLASQKVEPAKLLASGYRFQAAQVESAIRQILD